MRLISPVFTKELTQFAASRKMFDEHRANTLPLLFLTQLTPFNIANNFNRTMGRQEE